MLSVRILLIQLALHSQAMLFNLNSLFQQPKAFKHYNGTAVTWFDAIQKCKEKGGVLAFFDSAHDHLMALKNIPVDGRVWLGYSQLNPEGAWRTVYDEEPEYIKWIEGQPDNRMKQEHCGMLVMGPWGRGRMMDAKCDEPNGVKEWSIPATYLCRFDGPKRSPVKIGLMGEDKEDFANDEEEKVLADWVTTPAPKISESSGAWVGEGSWANSTVVDQLETRVGSALDAASTNTKELKRLKEKMTDVSLDIQQIANSTDALKNDNRLIFEKINHLLTQQPVEKAITTDNESLPPAASTQIQAHLVQESSVTLKSSVDDEEQKFFMTHQKSINKRMMSGLAKQKEQIKRLKVLVGDENVADGVNLEEYIAKAEEARLSANNEIQKLKMEVTLLKRTISQMQNSIVDFRNRLNG